MGSPSVFVYGTLLAPEILTSLLKRVPSSKPATLHGFARYSIQGRNYPAILKGSPSDKVSGLVLSGLSSSEVQIFDDYEDIDYTKITVPVSFQDGTFGEADTYLWQGDPGLLQGSWDYSDFRNKHLHAFMVSCGWLEQDC